MIIIRYHPIFSLIKINLETRRVKSFILKEIKEKIEDNLNSEDIDFSYLFRHDKIKIYSINIKTLTYKEKETKLKNSIAYFWSLIFDSTIV